MTVLIVGGSGFLGAELLRRAGARGWGVAATFWSRPGDPAVAAWHQLDVRDAARVEAVLTAVAPHTVIDVSSGGADWAVTAEGSGGSRVHYDESCAPDPVTPYGPVRGREGRRRDRCGTSPLRPSRHPFLAGMLIEMVDEHPRAKEELPMSHPDTTPGVIDTSKPHPARVYDFYLGGKDNYPVDEELGRQMLALEPGVRDMAHSNRAFMRRVTRWAAGEGIRQFLDIGTGIPTEPNLHQVAQAVAPGARVVYCDNDPIVLAHAEALMSGTPEGATTYVQGDVLAPEKILEQAAEVIDFSRPVQLSLIALLHFVSDEQGAYEVVNRLKEALAPGSQLVIAQAGFKADDVRVDEADARYRAGRITLALRPREDIARFFDGFGFVEPGLVGPDDWRPGLGELPEKSLDTTVLPFWVGAARKG